VLADGFATCGYFVKVDTPQKGDLVHFTGHIGIVTNPDMGEFIGAQTSTGVHTANYKHGYWAGDYHGKKPDYFLRWSR
jgi:cell wall-associated NlpC family hydrolase